MHYVKTGSSAHCTPPWPKLRAHYAHAACTAPCRSAHWAVSWRAPALYRGRAQPCHRRVATHTSHVAGCVASPPPIMIQKLYRDPTPAVRTARRVARVPGCIAGRVAALYRSPAAPYYDTTVAPQPRYNFLYRDSHLARPCARALLHTPRASQPCRRPYRGRLLALSQACSAVSWPCPF